MSTVEHRRDFSRRSRHLGLHDCSRSGAWAIHAAPSQPLWRLSAGRSTSAGAEEQRRFWHQRHRLSTSACDVGSAARDDAGRVVFFDGRFVRVRYRGNEQHSSERRRVSVVALRSDEHIVCIEASAEEGILARKGEVWQCGKHRSYGRERGRAAVLESERDRENEAEQSPILFTPPHRRSSPLWR